jgi:hypothetical protein
MSHDHGKRLSPVESAAITRDIQSGELTIGQLAQRYGLTCRGVRARAATLVHRAAIEARAGVNYENEDIAELREVADRLEAQTVEAYRQRIRRTQAALSGDPEAVRDVTRLVPAAAPLLAWWHQGRELVGTVSPETIGRGR